MNQIRIEAEDYTNYYDTTSGNSGGTYRNDSVDIGIARDIGGGYNVGSVDTGEWLTYDVLIPEDGIYNFKLRYSSNHNINHRLGVQIGSQESQQLSFNYTGGWHNWNDATLENLNLSAGNQTLRLDFLTPGFNLNYFELVKVGDSVSTQPSSPVNNPPTTQPPVTNPPVNNPTLSNPLENNLPVTNSNPIRIEAEDYTNYYDTTSGNSGGRYRNDNVDISMARDVGGGYNVGSVDTGEWLTYDVLIPEDGIYNFKLRYSSNHNINHRLGVQIGSQESQQLSFNYTGGWHNWNDATLENLNLSAGNQTLRLDFLTPGFNLNYFELVKVGDSPSQTTTNPDTPTNTPTINFGSLIYGGNGNQNFTGNEGTETITYERSYGGIIANLETGIVSHNFATSPTTPLRIMAVGDSNTHERKWDPGTYRDDLKQSLSSDGFNVDFVGPSADGFFADNQHAARGGWKIDDISNNISGRLSTYQPDMVLLMIGTNDIVKQDRVDSAPERLSSLIDQITDHSPQTQLLVASIAPMDISAEHEITAQTLPLVSEFNAELQNIVTTQANQGKNVGFVDVFSALTTDDLQDGLHPTTDGYAKVADAWYEAILNTSIGEDNLNNIENIIGSPYNDVLIGNAQNNIIDGGTGDDILTGGGGDDVFVISRNSGTDTITDFGLGNDRIALAGGLTAGELSITQGLGNNATDTWIQYGSDLLASLIDVQASEVASLIV